MAKDKEDEGAQNRSETIRFRVSPEELEIIRTAMKVDVRALAIEMHKRGLAPLDFGLSVNEWARNVVLHAAFKKEFDAMKEEAKAKKKATQQGEEDPD